ncbi:MAG: sel1 repeat family protein [Firmicutes bacterium]|nr:sel1 repeat family protein [Bacillota bacterium]
MEKETQFSEALHAYEVRHFEQAFTMFSKLAKKKDLNSIYYLGLMYFSGLGAKQNSKEAFRLFSIAAIELHTEAIYMLGRCYEEASGVEENLKQAFEYYTASALQGSKDGALKVAEFYELGKGIPYNLSLALTTYVELAKKDHPYAMYKIGMAYFTGNGIKKSWESAHSWLNKALTNGSIDAMNQFRLMGSTSKTDFRETKDIMRIGIDLFESNRVNDSIIYFEIAAKEGNGLAYRYLSDAYFNGKGVKKSLETAFEYLSKAANLKDPSAMYTLGKRYETGEGTPSSFTKAAKWYEAASLLGYELAKIELKGIRGY